MLSTYYKEEHLCLGKTSEALVDLLIDWGVEHIYGMPGDSINSIIEALRKNKIKLNLFKFAMKKLVH